MVRKRYIWKALFASAVFFLLPLVASGLPGGQGLHEFLLYTAGGGFFSPLSGVQFILLAVSPTLVLFFLFSDYLSCDFEAMSVYIFTKAPKPMKYFRRKLLYLAACLLGYTVLCVLFAFFTGLASGWPVLDGTASLLLGEMVFLYLHSLTLVGFINVLSLWIKPYHSFLLTATAYTVGVMAIPFLDSGLRETVCAVFPLTQGLYAWHKEALPILSDPTGLVSHVPLAASICYLLLLLALEYGVLARFIKKADFL